jgi:hypothetical protein
MSRVPLLTVIQTDDGYIRVPLFVVSLLAGPSGWVPIGGSNVRSRDKISDHGSDRLDPQSLHMSDARTNRLA